MTKLTKCLTLCVVVLMMTFCLLAPSISVQAAGEAPVEEQQGGLSDTSAKALSAGIAIAVAAGGGALAMALSISKAVESIGRQPEASGMIRTVLMLGLVFIETAIIYALIVTILVIFVL